MAKGRKPKPTVLHVLEGTLKPERHAGRTDQRATGTPDKPTDLDAEANALWGMIQGELGTLTKRPAGPALAQFCRLWSRLRQAEQLFDIDILEVRSRDLYLKLLAQWHKMASDFGLTPAARCKLTIPAKDEQDTPEKRFFG